MIGCTMYLHFDYSGHSRVWSTGHNIFTHFDISIQFWCMRQMWVFKDIEMSIDNDTPSSIIRWMRAKRRRKKSCLVLKKEKQGLLFHWLIADSGTTIKSKCFWSRIWIFTSQIQWANTYLHAVAAALKSGLK